MIEPNITIDMPKAPRLAKVKIEVRNSRSGTTGSGTRNSTNTNAVSSSVPATNRPMITGELHGYDVPPHETASSTAVTPSDMVTMPQVSITALRGSCGRSRKRAMTNSATRPTGTATKNNQRQPSESVITPPASGPATLVTPNTTPIQPWYLPR